MSNYPRMLYKFPGAEEMHGARFATKIVGDDDSHAEAIGDGWAETTTEARQLADSPKEVAPVVVVPAPAPDQGEDTQDRDSLKAEATELGLEFPKNVPTERLAEMIAEAKAKE